jgi:hypothetical protein
MVCAEQINSKLRRAFARGSWPALAPCLMHARCSRAWCWLNGLPIVLEHYHGSILLHCWHMLACVADLQLVRLPAVEASTWGADHTRMAAAVHGTTIYIVESSVDQQVLCHQWMQPSSCAAAGMSIACLCGTIGIKQRLQSLFLRGCPRSHLRLRCMLQLRARMQGARCVHDRGLCADCPQATPPHHRC